MSESSRQIVLARSSQTQTPLCGGRGQLTGSSTTLYTAPNVTSPTGATQRSWLTSIIFTNTDSSARTVTLYLVENAGSIGANRTIISAESIAAGARLMFGPFDPPIPLESGETIRGLASVTAVVTYRISVIELT